MSKLGVRHMNFDTWVNIFPHGELCVAWAPADRNVPEADEMPEWCQDLSYWDNTDKPDDVDDEEWAHRGRMWELSGALDQEQFSAKLTHTVLEFADATDSGKTALSDMLMENHDQAFATILLGNCLMDYCVKDTFRENKSSEAPSSEEE